MSTKNIHPNTQEQKSPIFSYKQLIRQKLEQEVKKGTLRQQIVEIVKKEPKTIGELARQLGKRYQQIRQVVYNAKELAIVRTSPKLVVYRFSSIPKFIEPDELEKFLQ